MSKDSFDSEFFRKATKVIPNGGGLGNNPATARVEMELAEIKDAKERYGKAVGVMKGNNKE